MRGTGPVVWGRETVYAYYTSEENAVRVRVSVDEADRLGLTEGLRAWVRFPGQEQTDVLVMRVGRTPPFVWVELAVMSPVASRAG